MKRALLFLLSFFLAWPAQAQWLDDATQARERKLWELTGVEFPQGMKFYDLPKVSQRLVGIIGYSPENRYGIFSDTYGGRNNVNAMFPWVTPSGLHDSPKDQWRKAAAAYFPSPVAVYVETVQVQNGIRDGRGGFFSQPQPHVAWDFSDGTLFAELLIRTHGNQEWPFELRFYEVRDNKLVDGTTYRPFASADDLPHGTTKSKFQVPPGKLTDFGFEPAIVITHDLPKKTMNLPRWTDFRPTKFTVSAVDDESSVPRDFVGSVRSCVDCHQQAGKSTSYGSVTIRGSRPNLSWHPFVVENLNTDAMPRLDGRWDLKVKSKQLQVR